MCEIFVMLKTGDKKVTRKELERFLSRAITGAESNRDGWGVMCEHWFMRTPQTMTQEDIKHIVKTYVSGKPSNFFALHLRIATCAVKQEFNHPFSYPGFMAMHNGIVTVEGKNSGSDSWDMFDALNDAKNDKNSIYEAMAKAFKAKVSGSYSILLYSDYDNSLYYVRNTPPFDFMYVKSTGTIYGASDIDRLRPLDKKEMGFFSTALITRPAKDILYKIDLKTGTFTRAGKIEEKPEPYVYRYNGTQTKKTWGQGRGWGFKKNRNETVVEDTNAQFYPDADVYGEW